jgi:mono/diheme cytochrome c family protein
MLTHLAGLCLAATATTADSAPGLILRFEADGSTDARLARTVTLFVPRGSPTTPFLARGPFKASWEGSLVLEKRSRLIFTLEGTGKARLLIDDEVLVEKIGTPNESKRLSGDEHKVVCEYESPTNGDDAQLRLFWEERSFPREPVPATAFIHDPSDAVLAEPHQLRHGRSLVAETRCLACHDSPSETVMPELRLGAPSLDGIGARLRRDWMALWIANPKALRPSAHMPVLFEDNAEKNASDIAAYLAAGIPDIEVTQQPTAAQMVRGGHLFQQQGCIACHTLTPTGDTKRIGLAHVGRKFRLGSLTEFLREPSKFHQATRMPTFHFSSEEGRALAGFLRSLADNPDSASPGGDESNGKKLFASSGCLNCHARGDEKSTLPIGPPLTDLKTAECTTARFALSGSDTSNLVAFLNNTPGHASLGRSVPAEFSLRQFDSLRCAACHSRDGGEPMREKFASEVAHLVPPEPDVAEGVPALKLNPPPLDHLGLKLRPEWRAKLLSGQIEPKVRPWLPTRMPAFPTRADALSLGFNHAAGLPGAFHESTDLDAEKVKIGAAMTGLTGLACATCHGIGDKPAIAVFEGEGPNLHGAARLTPDYFRLWMMDPQRVWPGTIMPKYAVDGKTPLIQYYDGDAAKQFDAIYEYLRSLSENSTSE